MKTKFLPILLLTCLQVRAQSGTKATGENCTCVPIAECGFKTPLVLTFRQLEDCDDNWLHICCTEENIIRKILPNPPAATCGHRNRNGLHFQLTSENLESQYAEFPWMIEISFNNNINVLSKPVYRYIAGGALITPSAVITVAHRVMDRTVTQLRVRAGEWERSTMNEPFEHQDRNVSRIITHEDYNEEQGFNGIAILILQSAINFEGHINKICLPPINYDFGGNRCFVTGWGADARDDDNIIKKPVNILKKIDLPVVEDQLCQTQLRKTRLGPRYYLHPSFMCAGGEEDKDACFGDGGSPLVCPIPNSVDKYYLAGIVVGGIDCGLTNVPGLYIEVSKFLPWINEHIANYN